MVAGMRLMTCLAGDGHPARFSTCPVSLAVILVSLVTIVTAVANADNWPLSVAGPEGCWSLRLTRESPVIPLSVRYDDVSDEGAKLAVMAAAGNNIVEYVRNRQDALRWFLGVVEPADSCRAFTWPPSWKLALVFDDGRRLAAKEAFATRGRADLMGPRLAILPGGAELLFTDFEITFPAGKTCMIWVGFPRGDWDKRRVRELRIEGATEVAQPAAALAPGG